MDNEKLIKRIEELEARVKELEDKSKQGTIRHYVPRIAPLLKAIGKPMPGVEVIMPTVED